MRLEEKSNYKRTLSALGFTKKQVENLLNISHKASDKLDYLITHHKKLLRYFNFKREIAKLLTKKYNVASLLSMLEDFKLLKKSPYNLNQENINKLIFSRDGFRKKDWLLKNKAFFDGMPVRASDLVNLIKNDSDVLITTVPKRFLGLKYRKKTTRVFKNLIIELKISVFFKSFLPKLKALGLNNKNIESIITYDKGADVLKALFNNFDDFKKLELTPRWLMTQLLDFVRKGKSMNAKEMLIAINKMQNQNLEKLKFTNDQIMTLFCSTTPHAATVRDYAVNNAGKIKRYYRNLQIVNILKSRQGIDILNFLWENREVFKKKDITDINKMAIQNNGLDQLKSMSPGLSTDGGSSASFFNSEPQSNTIGKKRKTNAIEPTPPSPKRLTI
jgi:hypothetical protein